MRIRAVDLRSRNLVGVVLAGLVLGLGTPRALGAATAGEIEFVGRNALVKAEGRFERWRFTRAAIDREAPERSVVEVEVDVSSLDTGIGRRDDHLRSADFFDVEKFPTARVRVSDARVRGESAAGHPIYVARFELEIHGVRKTIEAEFELVSASPPEVRGEIVLDRLDFGIGSPHKGWNPMSIRQQIPVRFHTVLPES